MVYEAPGHCNRKSGWQQQNKTTTSTRTTTTTTTDNIRVDRQEIFSKVGARTRVKDQLQNCKANEYMDTSASIAYLHDGMQVATKCWGTPPSGLSQEGYGIKSGHPV